MQYREVGRTGWRVSAVSFGCWAIGGTWGPVEDAESLAALRRAVDLGVSFFDTADVYGDGRSERLLARLRRECGRSILIATKVGRRLSPHTAAGYTRENLVPFVDRSLRNLESEAIDLLQLHCPPADVYYQPEVFGVLDDLVKAGKIRAYGVSVERVEEALRAIEYPNVATVQIVFNLFRHRPAELLFERAKSRGVGILARVPLASGMLSGRMRPDTTFAADDHRAFNRHGEAFDCGETFSGVDYALGLRAVDEMKGLVPQGMTLAQFALRWILMHDAVSCAIPGAKHPGQVEENAASADAPALSDEAMTGVRRIYDRLMRDAVHARW